MPPKTAGASSSSQPSKKRQKHTAEGPLNTMGLKKLNSQQKEFFQTVAKRGLRQTKFPCTRILKVLGLTQPVTYLLTRVGLEGILKKEAPTYDRFTYEFLATLRKGENDNEKYITFRINDKFYTMSYDDVRTTFGWRDETDDAYNTTRSYNSTAFFSAITPGLPWGNNRKASSIPHPALRFVTVVLNMTVFCVETSNLPSNTLKALWAMTPKGEGCPDWVEIFVDRCIHIRGSGKGHINMGGMVTLLVDWLISHKHIKADDMDWPEEVVPKKEKEPKEPQLDRHQLRAREMLWFEDIEGQPPKYVWLYGVKKLFYMDLPQPRTQIDDSTTVSQLNLGPDKEYYKTFMKFMGKTLPKRARDDDDGDDDDDDDDDDEEGDGEDNDDDEEGEKDDEQPKSTYASLLRGLERQVDSMQLQLDGLEDQVGDIGVMVSAMNDYFLFRQDGYANPANTILEARHRRAAARAARRSGTRDPGGSSHD